MAQYPPNPQAYPPPYEGGGSYPSAPGDYPPANPGYPPANPGYPPAGYPPTQPGYPPTQPGYPPASGGYPPASGGYPPASGGYPPASGGYPPAGYPQPQSYPPGPQPGYAPQGYPQPQHGFNAPGGYPPPGGVGAPISQQPTAGEGWMLAPAKPVSCPPGLEYLTTLDQLLVKQKVEILEALTGFETQNKYTVKNSLGQKVFYAVEDSSCCSRCFCGTLRPFDMKILDNFKNEVIHMYRPLACQSCWFPCCLQTLEVSSPPGCVVGSVVQEWSLFCPKFSIKNAAGDTVLYIEGPLCTYSICGDVEFKVLALDETTVVGRISKQWSGLLREAFTDADFFGVTFPMDLDVKMKAVMLAACFLIDFMFFDKTGGREEDGFGMC
uniref:Phospholipid scramblase n=1 Tax=Lygus hesperus TaxID=30085 RepID=A0A0A9XAE0_LYGHE